jgi:hypothetical protein
MGLCEKRANSGREQVQQKTARASSGNALLEASGSARGVGLQE